MTTPDTTAFPSLARRLACLAYESLLLAAILLLVSALYTPLQASLGASLWLDQAFRATLALALFAYFGKSWVSHGQTVAMKAWRLKLQTADGETLSWKEAAIRYVISLILFVVVPVLAYLGARQGSGHRPLVALASFSWCLLPFLATLVDPERLTLQDRLCGTRTVLIPKRSGKTA
ncbi:RDD family protein [Paludibacterium paludis]|uniref:RDD family protein n=1 Tax=Paludibacterium paludis TaxID=1225769 RepID=UPI001673ADFE|nr:RDD family protein [Paludibacterium paludis]